jgi:hypothetical protein
MKRRNAIVLTICALITTAIGGAITYYDHTAVNLQEIVFSDKNTNLPSIQSSRM